MRFNALSKTIHQLKEKIKYFKLIGDKKSLVKMQVILMISEKIKYSFISSTFNISVETIRLWLKDFLIKRFNISNQAKNPGRPSRLTKTQKRELKKLIDSGTENNGFIEGGWTCSMIQSLIENKFNVFYSVYYISSLMKNLGYSHQKATTISDKREEDKRKIWLEIIWPRILKEAETNDSNIYFGDEVSFSQTGTLSYTWAKKGHQPVIRTSGSKKSYKVFGLIEYFSGNFISMGWDGKLNSDSYIEFLKFAFTKTRKNIILIQDGASYHTSEEMEDFFSDYADRLTIYQLPVCSPDFNPIESLWKKMKSKGTHSKYFPTFDSLIDKVHELIKYFSNSKEEIKPLFGFYEKLNFFNAFKVPV